MELPQDLIERILLRLPVKSLSRFKCVCRSWHDRISESSFVRRQIDHAKTSHHEKDPTFMICCYFAEKFGTMVYDKNIDDGLRSALCFHEINLPPEFIADFVVLTGYCDGMFCLRVETTNCPVDGKIQFNISVYLWNPTIHDLKKLPPLPRGHAIYDLRTKECIEGYHNSGYGIFGIGYNSAINDYYICSSGSAPGSSVEILYLKKSNANWKTIGEFPDYKVDFSRCTTSYNGNLYCLAYRGKSNQGEKVVISLNGATEKFEELALPQDCGRAWELEAFQGCHLGLMTFCRLKGMGFWLFNDKDSSWSLFQQVPVAHCSTWCPSHGVFRMWMPLCITKSCVYFMKADRTGVVRYDLKGKTTYGNNWGAGKLLFDRKYELLETLISPSKLIIPDG